MLLAYTDNSTRNDKLLIGIPRQARTDRKRLILFQRIPLCWGPTPVQSEAKERKWLTKRQWRGSSLDPAVVKCVQQDEYTRGTSLRIRVA